MDSGGARAARSESAPDSLLPCPLPQRSLRGTRAAPGSTYNRTAIPRVLPGCKHNKRERHRVVRCQVGSLYDVQAAEQTAHPKSGPRRRPGITSDRCTQIGEQPEYLLRSAPFIAVVNSSTFGAKMPRAEWTFVGSL